MCRHNKLREGNVSGNVFVTATTTASPSNSMVKMILATKKKHPESHPLTNSRQTSHQMITINRETTIHRRDQIIGTDFNLIPQWNFVCIMSLFWWFCNSMLPVQLRVPLSKEKTWVFENWITKKSRTDRPDQTRPIWFDGEIVLFNVICYVCLSK